MEVKITPEGKLYVFRLIDGITPERFTLCGEETLQIGKYDFVEIQPAPDPEAKRQLSFNYG